VIRLAFFSPIPPAGTGIADYSADVLSLLAGSYSIDVYHDQEDVDRARLDPRLSIVHARGFMGQHEKCPYDLVIYQLGNGPQHAFLEPFTEAVPGLLVLHDLVLHHSRARRFLASSEAQAYARDPSNASLREAARPSLLAYRSELLAAYPNEGDRLFEAQLGTVGSLLPYAYPLFHVPVRRARLTLVHNAFMARTIREQLPEAVVREAPMPMSRLPCGPGPAEAVRKRLGIGPGDFVVGSFGLLTPEKQLDTIARCVARASVAVDRLRLLLVGDAPGRQTLEELLLARGVKSRTILTGRVPHDELAAHLEACDMVMHLRYPTARETSAALLRVLAQGRPTVMTDLENLAEIPEGAVIRTNPTDEEGDGTRALLRLASRPDLRASLGRAAAEFVRTRHDPSRARDAYVAAIEDGISRTRPPSPLRA
jgi:glycosyltransferase involved in cell wall biosynthesis